MKTIEIKEIGSRERGKDLIASLTALWEASVRETHHFLSEQEIQSIKPYVPEALQAVPVLLVLDDPSGNPAAFLGVEGHRIEMLFAHPEERGHGLGRALLEKAEAHFGADEVTVNEQNPQAVGFYSHMGFSVYKQTAEDEQGRPYPLLYMRLAGTEKKG